MARSRTRVPEHVPDDWVARYLDPPTTAGRQALLAARLAEVERSARRDSRVLTFAASLCLLLLLLAVGLATVSDRSGGLAWGWYAVATLAALTLCLLLVQWVRRSRRRS